MVFILWILLECIHFWLCIQNALNETDHHFYTTCSWTNIIRSNYNWHQFTESSRSLDWSYTYIFKNVQQLKMWDIFCIYKSQSLYISLSIYISISDVTPCWLSVSSPPKDWQCCLFWESSLLHCVQWFGSLSCWPGKQGKIGNIC